MKAKKAKEPVRIRFKELANGNKSIYLDIYKEGTRKYEFLKLYIIPEKTPFDKQQNKTTMDAANAIKAQRIIELTNGKAGIVTTKSGKISVADFMLLYETEKAEKGQSLSRSHQIHAVAQLLQDYKPTAKMQDVDKGFCKGFSVYLQTLHVKNGIKAAQSTQKVYFDILSCALNYAVRQGYINENPIRKLEKDDKPKKIDLQRDFLTESELLRLIETPCNEKAKKPFLFSCFTGLRYGDVLSLTWGDIRTENGITTLQIQMQKTRETLSITIPNADKVLPNRGTKKAIDNIFEPICNTHANNCIEDWQKAAGIKGKHITFHTARHTYATLLLTKGADLYTVSKMLGHRKIATTQIYAEIIDKKKEEAANLLNGII